MSSSTVDPVASRANSDDPVASPANSDGPDDPGGPEFWPTALETWLRYWHIGRWNYAKGFGAAAVLSTLLAVAGFRVLALATIAGAAAYVLISGFGLYLLYGPPSERTFRKWFAMAGLPQDASVLDVHFGTWRVTRAALESFPDGMIYSVAVHDPDEENEAAVQDVWKFERPPHHRSQLRCLEGSPDQLPVKDHSINAVLLGFGIHEVHEGPERDALMTEIGRVLAPGGKVLLMERGWSPLLALVFGPLFLHFTPAKRWQRWLESRFPEVHRRLEFGMVDLFVASSRP